MRRYPAFDASPPANKNWDGVKRVCGILHVDCARESPTACRWVPGGGTPGARVRLDIAAGCRSGRAMSGMTRHRAGLPLRFCEYLRNNQTSLPESRRLSATPPTAMPLTGFAHSRAEKIRTKKTKRKIGTKMDRSASDRYASHLGLALYLPYSTPYRPALAPCDCRGGAPQGGGGTCRTRY
jgi:hypothetical protein